MASFLKHSDINAAIERIILSARTELILISPFVKFHSRIKECLNEHKENYQLKLIVVIGKNEEDLTRSINKQDFDFLKDFANVQIRYEPRLHAKYYANESESLLSSMNLYEYSHNNNIEFGVLSKNNTILKDGIDKEAYKYFTGLVENSKQLFHIEPQFKKVMFRNKYLESRVLHDELSEMYGDFMDSSWSPAEPEIMDKYDIASDDDPEDSNGYCIRTGKKIPFNLEKPYSYDAYLEYVNESQGERVPEKYCHYSGEESDGKTNIDYPVLRKNWKKATSAFPNPSSI